MAFVEYERQENFHLKDVSGKSYITAAWYAKYPSGTLALLYEKQPDTPRTLLHIVFLSGVSSKINRGERFVHATAYGVSVDSSSYTPELDDNGKFKGRLPTQDISLLRGFWPSVRRSADLPPLLKTLYKKAAYG